MLLAVAAWEGFCEEIVSVSATRISRRLRKQSALPDSIVTPLMYWFHEEANLSMQTDHSKKAMWDIAGDGWRSRYREYINKKVDDLNTPSFSNLKNPLLQTTGAKVGSNWNRGTRDCNYYVLQLENMLTIRHEIAHGARGDVTVGKKTARKSIALIERLAKWIDATITANETSLALGDADIE